METIVYLCDAALDGPPQGLCRAQTEGSYLTIGGAAKDKGLVRYDLCPYHAAVVRMVLRGELGPARDPAEASCP